MKNLLTLLSILVVGAASTLAGTERTVDARSFMVPTVSAAKTDAAQASFERTFMLQHDAAREAFEGAGDRLTLTNVEVPAHGVVTLELERTASVFDANTQFLVNTPNGKKPFTVRPIQSYKGTVDGDPQTWVTLHYSTGDLTGFIQHADGDRTLVGRAWNLRHEKGASPHVMADESVNGDEMALANFVCGVDDLAVNEADMVQKMTMPSTLKKGEDMQSLPLKEIKLAIVLREDIDSVLQLRGYDDEQTAQHFAKVVACMSQAYEEDLRARMYISYLLVHTLEQPSFYFYDGAAPGELLEEFSQDWSSAYNHVDRTVAHLYTRKKPVGGLYVGGIAYLDKMCSKQYRGGYGVSTVDLVNPANLPGDPTSRNGFVWDIFVASHEIGHNVGAPHTHNCYWSPPVDTCMLQSDNTDACFTSGRRVIPGTIMSYCHLRNGSSTPLTFGPRVSERMRTWIEAAPCVVDVPNPYVNITTPRGSESWDGGADVMIKWTSARVDRVNLDYSPDGGDTWKPIVADIPAADSQYVWTLPNVGTSQLYIRISDVSDPSVNNISIASHTIEVPIEFAAPEGGERVGVGSEFSIRLRKALSVGDVDLEYTNGDGEWKTIVEDLSASIYSWTVPNDVTSVARIRATSTTNSEISTISEVFAIGAPLVDLRIPMEGGELCNNFDNQFRWYSDFVDRIRIQYSTDNGATWERAIQPITIPANQIEIFSLHSSMKDLAEGTKVQLRIVESNTEEVLASLNELTITSCEAVVSVDEEAPMQERMSIDRVTPNPASTTVSVTINHATSSTVDVMAVDQSGATIMLISQEALSGAGQTVVTLPVERLSSGAYRLVVRSGSAWADAPLQIVR